MAENESSESDFYLIGGGGIIETKDNSTGDTIKSRLSHMKIAVDCADLDHERIDGTRVYIKNLLDKFGQIDSESQFFLYHQKDFNPLLAPKFFSNYIDRKIPYRFWWTHTRFAFELRRDKPDVCWMPIQQLPFVRDGKKTKFVVTMHDLAFKIYPECFPRGDRTKLNLFADYAVKRADKIIAVSNSTKNDILKFYPKIKETKIEVIYHGFDNDDFGKNYSQEEIGEVLKKYGIVGNEIPLYILYVGAIQPRKNISVLVEAFEKLKKENGFSNLKLVIAGEPAWQANGTLDKIKRSEMKDEIILTGKVGFQDLAKIYQGAKAFIFPSLYEGFGMPILEAWASRAAVIAADNSSLSEIGADAVEKFNASDAEELKIKMQKILTDDKMRNELVDKGSARLQNFSWEKCARQTLDEIKKTGLC